MLQNLALGEAHLQVDFVARLRQQALAVGRGGGGDALVLGGDFFGAAFAEGVEFARQRLPLLLDGGGAARWPRP